MKCKETKQFDLLAKEIILYKHYKNNKFYNIVDVAKMQINNKWVNAIIYTEYKKKEKYVRTKKDFHKKFRKFKVVQEKI